MERRRYERIAVNLNVALLDDRAMPRGCRVRDVSRGGMLLQFEHPVSSGSFEPSDAVKVRVSLKEGHERSVLLLPATIRRVEEKGLGVEFHKPAAELMQLVEPYQLDRPKAVEATGAATATAGLGTAAGVPSPAVERPSRPRYRTATDTGARLARRIAAVRAAVAGSGADLATKSPASTTATARPADRRMLQVGLASLAVAVAVVVFDLATTSSTSHRLNALEQATNRQAETLAGLQIRLTAANGQQDRVAELRTQINELAVAVTALETGHFAPADTNVTSSAPPANPAPQADVGETQRPLQISPGAAAAAGPAQDAAADGPWVLNLVSLFDQTAADQFAEKARSAGIPAEQSQALVKGKPVWRLQVSGFASREAASRYGDANKTKLGLKNVWIFKR